MKTELERFHETVGILVKAYMNNELKHQDCQACVVGNLCGGSVLWRFLFMTDETGKQRPTEFDNFWRKYLHFDSKELLLEEATNVCLSTGYTIDQLARIEYAFETTPQLIDEDEWMFNGLMSVVDVLADIHGIDLEQKESAKLLFVK